MAIQKEDQSRTNIKQSESKKSIWTYIFLFLVFVVLYAAIFGAFWIWFDPNFFAFLIVGSWAIGVTGGIIVLGIEYALWHRIFRWLFTLVYLVAEGASIIAFVYYVLTDSRSEFTTMAFVLLYGSAAAFAALPFVSFFNASQRENSRISVNKKFFVFIAAVGTIIIPAVLVMVWKFLNQLLNGIY